MSKRMLLPCVAVLLVGPAFGQANIDYLDPPSVQVGSNTPVTLTGTGFFEPSATCPAATYPPVVKWYGPGTPIPVTLTVTGIDDSNPLGHMVTVDPPGGTWAVEGTGSLTVTPYLYTPGPVPCVLAMNPSLPYNLVVTPPPPPPLKAFCGTPPIAIVGQPFSYRLAATGGVPPYGWTPQEIVPGIELAADGTVSGVFSAEFIPGVTFGTSVQDSAGCPPASDVCGAGATASVSDCVITVQLPSPTPVITAYTPTSATACGPPFTLSVSGQNFLSNAALGFGSQESLSYNQLLTSNSITTLSAIIAPSLFATPGAYTIVVENPNGSGWQLSGPKDLPIRATPQILGMNPSSAEAGSGPLSIAITGSNFVPGVTVALWGGSRTPLQVENTSASQMTVTLPASLLSAGSYGVRVVNRDDANPAGTPYADSCSPSRAFRVLAIIPADLPQGKVGVSYPSVTFAASGGRAPYTFAIAEGSVPGLTLANGMFGGTPTDAGTYRITVRVTDSSSPVLTWNHVYSLLIQRTDLQIAGPAALADGKTGVPYGPVSFSASGGAGPYSWDLASGQAPGLSLGAAGVLTGTPTQAGTYALQVRVTDEAKNTATGSYTLHIAQSLVILPDGAALPSAIVQRTYSHTFTAQGGAGGYVWDLVAGSPPGLALDSGGVLSGRPTAANTYTLTVRVRDGAGEQISRTYTLTVSPPPAPGLALSSTQPLNPTDQSTVSPALLSSVEDSLELYFKLEFAPNAAGLPPGYRDKALALTPVDPITITPQNAGTPPSLKLSLGTVAGTVTVSVDKCYVSGTTVEVDLGNYPSTTVEIRRSAPVIVPGSVHMSRTQAGLSVELDGYSTPRDLSGAVVTFNAASGAQLTGATTSTIDLSSGAATWYASEPGLDAGSAFHLSLPFPVTGDLSAIGSVSVQLKNSVGSSASESGRMQ